MSKRKRDASKEEENLQKFKKDVKDLKSKSSSKINALTDLANKLQDDSQEVANSILDEISNAPLPRLRPLVMVLDCILKKVGKDYKNHFQEKISGVVLGAYKKSDAEHQAWLQKMANDSWRKHNVFPERILDSIDNIFAPSARGAAAGGQVHLQHAQPVPPPPQQLAPQQMSHAVTGATPMHVDTPAHVADRAQSATLIGRVLGPQGGTAWAAPASAPEKPPKTAATPPVKAPPPHGMVDHAAERHRRGAETAAAATPAASSQAASESPEVVERRLKILTKIIDRGIPDQEELAEIMRVPDIVRAMKMQHLGQTQEAVALLKQFKKDLENRHTLYQETLLKKATPGQSADARKVDPRLQDNRPADPRQQRSIHQEANKPVDPRQLSARPADPRNADVRSLDPRKSDPRPGSKTPDVVGGPQLAPGAPVPAVPKRQGGLADLPPVSHPPAETPASLPEGGSAVPPASDEAIPLDTMSDGEDEMAPGTKALPNGQGAGKLVQPLQVLQGLPSIGFSEAWLRQFMEQMPTRTLMPEVQKLDAPRMGRKVLSASGEQLVYVDELSANEVMLLLQLIFLLEERVRSNSGGPDVAQRIPHTFSYLQVEPAIDVMLKRFFDELPYQCTTTGLRFASREKLRKHHDALYRRRTLLQQRQRGAEARGWMESIPEWVGNRDLVVGPALFRLGGAGDEAPKVLEANRGGGDAVSDVEDEGGERSRWLCPLDERRSICPISGEAFERTWSSAMNDWAFTDVVAVELGASKPLKFRPGRTGFPQQLSETAVLFKKSCFFNTTPAKRLEALEECQAMQAPLDAGPRPPSKSAIREDAELAALAATQPMPRKFF